MAVFFSLVGLEVTREILGGELASAPKAYAAHRGGVRRHGRAGGDVQPPERRRARRAGMGHSDGNGHRVALGALAILGRRVAPSLRVFLTAITIADDLGTVAVIAMFYTDSLIRLPLQIAAAILLVLTVVTRTGISHVAPYLLLGPALWVAVLKSGVHPTIAGVLLAFTIPSAGECRRTAVKRRTPFDDQVEVSPETGAYIMELTSLVAKVVGPLLLVRGVSILLDRRHFTEMVRGLEREVTTVSFSALPIGLLMACIAITALHSDTSSVAAILVHLMAWGGILKASALILFPRVVVGKARALERGGFLNIVLVVCFLVGGYFTWFGYFASR